MSQIPKLSTEREVLIAGKMVHLKLYLDLTLRTLKESQGSTDGNEALDTTEGIERLMKQLDLLGADLLVAVKKGNDLFQVSDDEDWLLIDLPNEVRQLADQSGMELREYVMQAIQNYHPNIAKGDTNE